MLLGEASCTRGARVWVISDGRGLTGNLNGCLGIAEQLGNDIHVIDITDITQVGGIQNYLSEVWGLGYSTPDDWPDYVVSFYRNTAPIAADIKRIAQSRGVNHPVVAVQTRTPGERFNEFDLIANPSHEAHITEGNVAITIGVPHRVNKKTLSEGFNQWKDMLFQNPAIDKRKKIFVVLGGDIPRLADYADPGGPYTEEMAYEFGKQINALAEKENASVLVTNSHRTTPEAWQAFMREIKVPAFFHDVNMHQAENPYMGLMAAADMVIASADSISICCEAAASGKPVLIANADAPYLRHTHKRMVRDMVEGGHARLFDPQSMERLDDMKPGKLLDETADIARMARDIYREKSQRKGKEVLEAVR